MSGGDGCAPGMVAAGTEASCGMVAAMVAVASCCGG
jgi:hypothetical protein